MSEASRISPDIICQLCGGLSFDPVLRVENANFSSNIKAYSILKCTNCKLSTMSPFPAYRDIKELYIKEGVFSVQMENPYADRLSFRFLEPLYQKYGTDLRFIAKQCLKLTREKDATVLDVGCSVGRLLDAFKLSAPHMEVSNLTGIDIDPNAKINSIPYLRQRIVIGDFLKYRFDCRFDIVTMRFVIEHLLDFHTYIERAVELLNPGGILFISTPDIDSPQARILKEEWKLINDPHQKIGHLRWFNRSSIEFLAEKYGLHTEKCTNRGELIYHYRPAVQKMLRKFLGREPASGRFIKHYVPRIINATVFDGLLAEQLGCGDGLYTFLRNPYRSGNSVPVNDGISSY